MTEKGMDIRSVEEPSNSSKIQPKESIRRQYTNVVNTMNQNNRLRYKRIGLDPLDSFGDIIFILRKSWKRLRNCRKEIRDEDIEKEMSGNQWFFRKAYNSFANDICIENILRSIKKLESGVAALIHNDKEKLEYQKLLYYSNSINFGHKQMFDKFKVTNDCLNFLQKNYAEQIDVDIGKGKYDLTVTEKEMDFNKDEKYEVGQPITLKANQIQERYLDAY